MLRTKGYNGEEVLVTPLVFNLDKGFFHSELLDFLQFCMPVYFDKKHPWSDCIWKFFIKYKGGVVVSSF